MFMIIKMVQYPCVEVFPKSGTGMNKGTLRAIFQKDALWKSGDVGKATVTFGSQRCAGCAPDASWSLVGKNVDSGWGPSMNLGFIDPPYIDFTFNGKTYSYTTDFKNATRNYCSTGPNTCSSGWVPGATVIHEFCHALGMLHEHQNNLFNSNSIKLDKNAVIEYYRNIGMTAEDASNNVLTRYSCETGDCQYEGSRFDARSIMLYALPDDWVIGTNPTKPNFILSELDKEWLRKQYPVDNNNMPRITFQFTDVSEPIWKQAWTTKTIIENLAPIVGVKFSFIFMDGTSFNTSPIEYPNISLPMPEQVTTSSKYLKRCTTTCNTKMCTRRCTYTPYTSTNAKKSNMLAIENFSNDNQQLNTGAIVCIVVFVVLIVIFLFVNSKKKRISRRR
jgi:hypothetical protein